MRDGSTEQGPWTRPGETEVTSKAWNMRQPASISSAYIFEKDKNMGRVSVKFKKNPFTKPINIVLGIAGIILFVCMPFSLTNTFISIAFGLSWPSLYFLQRKTLCYRVLKNFN